MKRIIILLLFSTFSIHAQQVQWASKIIKFSSDLGGKEFGIKRILGKPDCFPQGGYSPNAWTPKNAIEGKEFVIVGYENPQMVKQVAVFENLNAGCVSKIMVSTDGERFETVWARKLNYKTPMYKTTLTTDRSYYFGRKRRKIHEVPNVFNPGIENAILDKSYSNIIAVKVEFNFALLPGEKQIDAIGISDSETPIDIQPNSNEKLNTINSISTIQFPNNFNVSAPCISKDGKKMFVTSNSEEKDIIYSFTNENGNWINPKIETKLSDANAYNFVVFANSKNIIKGGNSFENGSNETGFNVFTLQDNTYYSLGQLKVNAYNNYENFADITATDDLKFLIFSIESDFSQGGLDLYFTKIKEDGTYGVLQNMGKVINSASSEINPKLLSDGKTLFFSSNGFSGYGNYDMYVTARLDDTWKNWSEPKNLGKVINSPDFDGQMTYDETTETLFYIHSSFEKTELVAVKLPLNLLQNK